MTPATSISRPTSTKKSTYQAQANTNNSGIEWELSSIPDSIPGIGLGIGIEKKGIGIELELTKNARN